MAAQPLAWVALLMLTAMLLVCSRPVVARRLGVTALVLLVFLGWEVPANAVLRSLESQHAPLPAGAPLDAFAGVIVLGGALDAAYVWTVPGQSALNEAAERMTEVLPLLRARPHLRLLFTGGEGDLLGSHMTEAQRAKVFFEAQGVGPERVSYESESRNTYENAVFSRAAAGVDATRPWLLLTSAWHMPRAMALFRRAGWNVTAYPVDFRTGSSTPWMQYSMDHGAKKWRMALHELLGILAYRLAGRA